MIEWEMFGRIAICSFDGEPGGVVIPATDGRQRAHYQPGQFTECSQTFRGLAAAMQWIESMHAKEGK